MSSTLILIAVILISGVLFLGEKKSTSRTIFFILVSSFIFLIARTFDQLGLLEFPEEHKATPSSFMSTSEGVMARGPEDILYFNEEYLITTSNDNISLWEIGSVQDVSDGGIFLIKGHKTESPQLLKLKIENFPQKVRFHPHGAYIRKEDQTLFAISHSYLSGGGDRVEVFKLIIEEQKLIYQYSLLFPIEFTGVLNNLIVHDKGSLFVTKYLKAEDPLEGRQLKSKLLQLEYVFHFIFGVKKTFVYSCIFDEISDKSERIPVCKAETQTASIMANGITWDGKQTVFVADTANKQVKSFRIAKGGLVQTGEISIPVSGDNLEYDPITGNIYTAGPNKPIDHMRLTAKCKAQNEIVEDLGDFFCTSGYIDSRTLTFSVLTTHKNGITGCSSAFLSGKNLFIGSWSSKSVAKYHL